MSTPNEICAPAETVMNPNSTASKRYLRLRIAVLLELLRLQLAWLVSADRKLRALALRPVSMVLNTRIPEESRISRPREDVPGRM